MKIAQFRSLEFSINDHTVCVAGMAHPCYYQSSPPLEVLNYLSDHGYKAIVSLDNHGVGEIGEILKKTNNSHYPIIIEDFHAPSLSQFYLLHDIIAIEISKNKNAKIAIHCLGGNGRTGTMLASIAIKEEIERMCRDGNAILDQYKPILSESVLVGARELVPATPLVSMCIQRIRNIKNGEHSVEVPEQVNALIELEKNLIDQCLRANRGFRKF